MIKKLVHRLGIIFIIVAVNCMLIGVIVEFHQVHVYKNNISFWHLQATKTIGKDTKKYIHPYTNFVKLLKTDYVVDQLQVGGDHVHFHLFEKTIYSRHLFDLITSEYRYDKTLRGPPIA